MAAGSISGHNDQPALSFSIMILKSLAQNVREFLLSLKSPLMYFSSQIDGDTLHIPSSVPDQLVMKHYL